jgi:hypothetical protein
MLYVLLDSAQMLVVMVYMLVMKGLLRREINLTEQLLIEAQDFTCLVRGLPKLPQYEQYSKIELKAALYHFFKPKVEA